MTLRFKSQSEYQRSFKVHRSRSASPDRCTPLAGLRSDQMGMSREPRLQRRRRRLVPRGPPRSVSSLHCQTAPQNPLAEHNTLQTAPPAVASKSHTGSKKGPEGTSKADVDACARASSTSKAVADVKAECGSEPEAEPKPDMASHLTADDGAEKRGPEIPVTPHHPKQIPSPSKHETQPPTAHHDPWQRARDRPAGQRSGQTEYNAQFSWKKPATPASPLLTEEQVVFSSSRSAAPDKLDTEYQRSFPAAARHTVPHPRPHQEHQRTPLFHIQAQSKKKRRELAKRLQPEQVQLSAHQNAAPAPQRKHRTIAGGENTDRDPPQVTELRQKATLYRRRAWGINFSRDHLNQLKSEYNALWEPADTATSVTQPSTPSLTSDPSLSHSSCCVEALDLASLSSSSSPRPSREGPTHRSSPALVQRSPPAETLHAWGEEQDEKDSDEEEGRMTTPKLKLRPVQRTHHDITTPATGGAVLVGAPRDPDEGSPDEALPERTSCSSSRTPLRRHPSLSPVAPPPLTSPPQHGIRGGLRHADFQHNGDLGLRWRERRRSEEDERLSVMSCRSAASCSMASAVLERAQRRRLHFWGKS